MALAKLSSLPNELLISIFSYVAADVRQGHITATLSPVCSSFHRLIQSSGLDVMYTFLRGINETRMFLSLVQSRPMAQRRVYSLLLVVERNGHKDTASNAPALSAMEAILSTIDTSHLHTLFLYAPFRNGEEAELQILGDERFDVQPPFQLPVPLPALADLHLSGLIAVSPAGNPPYAPNVQRLQLLRLYGLPEPYDDLPPLLYNLAPNVTRLKLSIRSLHAAYFDQLLDFCETTSTGFRTPDKVLAENMSHGFPTSLKQIVGCLTYDRGNVVAASTLPLLKRFADDAARDLHKIGEIAPLVVTLPLKGRPDYIPMRGKDDHREVYRFIFAWMSLNIYDLVTKCTLFNVPARHRRSSVLQAPSYFERLLSRKREEV
ncbi:hypothetical protein EIP91_008041 [Steccherinum ochraceum]|uniref:F-box domain-containing protein n=1 Tax=Steccherinum ochraceum TaxID=92696 RepID=A0A4R0R3C2_9APHY|nr:hypothetical protein EIP91_008041 [Steccherinum ochraceum]